MSENKPALVSQSSVSVIPSADEWGTIHNMAKALIPTGFLPSSIKTPEQATAIILKGRELNVPPMYALSNIVVVQGKPTVSAEMMLALVQRDHGINAMWVEESTNEQCTVGYRSGNGTKFYTWTLRDAEAAGLTKNPTWRSYPAAMCRARAISATARMAFPGSIAGMYVPGELGDDVEVDDDGVLISASPTPEVAPGRAQRQHNTPDTQHRQTPPQRGAQGLTATVDLLPDERYTLNAKIHAQFPHDLLHDLAVNLWKKGSFADMSLTDLKNLDILLKGEGRPTAKQEEFDMYVDAWEATHGMDDEPIEGDVVQGGLDELNVGEDVIQTPASFRS